MAMNSKLVPRARELRRNMTEAEEILWQALRKKQFENYRFRRQMPFVFGEYHFVADFCCPKLKLIIEVDGVVHSNKEVKEYDNLREDILRLAGYKIFRCNNREILYNLGDVLKKLENFIENNYLAFTPP